jgi:hypothetical protein
VLAKFLQIGESFTQSSAEFVERDDRTLQVKSTRSILNVALGLFLASVIPALATPANKAAMERYYERFEAKTLKRCTTCHLPSDNKEPKNLDEFHTIPSEIGSGRSARNWRRMESRRTWSRG